MFDYIKTNPIVDKESVLVKSKAKLTAEVERVKQKG